MPNLGCNFDAIFGFDLIKLTSLQSIEKREFIFLRRNNEFQVSQVISSAINHSYTSYMWFKISIAKNTHGNRKNAVDQINQCNISKEQGQNYCKIVLVDQCCRTKTTRAIRRAVVLFQRDTIWCDTIRFELNSVPSVFYCSNIESLTTRSKNIFPQRADEKKERFSNHHFSASRIKRGSDSQSAYKSHHRLMRFEFKSKYKMTSNNSERKKGINK